MKPDNCFTSNSLEVIVRLRISECHSDLKFDAEVVKMDMNVFQVKCRKIIRLALSYVKAHSYFHEDEALWNHIGKMSISCFATYINLYSQAFASTGQAWSYDQDRGPA